MAKVATTVTIDRAKYDRLIALINDELTGMKLARNCFPSVSIGVGRGMKMVIRDKRLVWRAKMIRSVKAHVGRVSAYRAEFKVGPQTGYSATLEEGKPHIANIAKLQEWVRDKLGLTGRDAQNVTWALFKKFRHEGARKHPFKATAIRVGARRVRPLLNQALKMKVRQVRASV